MARPQAADGGKVFKYRGIFIIILLFFAQQTNVGQGFLIL
jgi:hypothetical protein